MLKLRLFLWQNCTLYWTDLKANAAVNAGGKIDPVPAGSLSVFSRSFVDAGNGTGINTVGDAFANVSHNGMRHR